LRHIPHQSRKIGWRHRLAGRLGEDAEKIHWQNPMADRTSCEITGDGDLEPDSGAARAKVCLASGKTSDTIPGLPFKTQRNSSATKRHKRHKREKDGNEPDEASQIDSGSPPFCSRCAFGAFLWLCLSSYNTTVEEITDFRPQTSDPRP
jgi:hypothetical protein